MSELEIIGGIIGAVILAVFGGFLMLFKAGILGNRKNGNGASSGPVPLKCASSDAIIELQTSVRKMHEDNIKKEIWGEVDAERRKKQANAIDQLVLVSKQNSDTLAGLMKTTDTLVNLVSSRL